MTNLDSSLDGFTERLPFVNESLQAAPDLPGVHVVWDPEGRPLYVGHTLHLRSRMRNHVSGTREGSVLRDKIGKLLDKPDREATPEEIRAFLAKCQVAWKPTEDRFELKAGLMDLLDPAFNELRPRTKREDVAGSLDALPPLLEETLDALRLRSGPDGVDAYRSLVEEKIPAVVRSIFPSPWTVKGRTLQGNIAEVPWVGIFPFGGDSAKSGVYVVYLFAADGSAVYLSLNQGTENVKGGRSALRKRALDIRTALGLQEGTANHDPALGGSQGSAAIDLRSDVDRPRSYEAGSALEVRYEVGAVPGSDVLQRDLDRYAGLLGDVIETGLTFDPELEPVHLVLKWDAERGPSTVADHRRIAEERGSVWWGKFGTPGGKPAISSKRLQAIRQQLEDGSETHCYPYRNGEVWRARLEEITDDPADVDSERLPGYYSTDDCCDLFVRLSDFEPLAADWPLSHLLMTNKPDPAGLPGALKTQTTPLFVYGLIGFRRG